MEGRGHVPLFLFLLFSTFSNRGIYAASPIVAIVNTPISVAEDTPLQTVLGTYCTSSDADGGATTSGTYYIDFNGGNGDQNFVVAPSNLSCSVYLVRPLDIETTTSYSLTVQATDMDSNTGDSNLVIDVTDANDNAPLCDPAVVVGTLAEDAAAADQFSDLYIKCSDVDTGTGAQFEFYVVSGDTTFIDVGQTDGVASLKANLLDYESAQTHSVMVEVRDKGTPSLTSTVTLYLEVTDVDDNMPAFQDGASVTVTLSENSAVGTTVTTLTTTDADSDTNSNNVVTYGFDTGPTPNWISIDTRTGALIVKDTVDYETSATIVARVSAYSSTNTGSKAYIDVTITVSALNDNSPVFAQTYYQESVAENANFGDTVVTTAATDLDGDTLIYSMSGTGATDFDIDTSTGAITVKSGSDYETQKAYLLTVTATDGTNSATVYLQISVTSVNEETPVFSPFAHTGTYHFYVSEDITTGTSVYTVTASDDDDGDAGDLTFSVITAGASFTMDEDTGVIRVTTDLNYESGSTELFVIQAVDKDGTSPLTATATFTASITDINDVAVPCSDVTTKFIPDPASISYIVATLACTDVDLPTDPITYSITSQVAVPSNTAVSTFSMSGGDLTLASSPTYTRFLVTIEATDGTNTTDVEVYVVSETVLTINTLPDITVEEGLSGISLFNITWSDVYPYTEVEITSGNTDNKVILYRSSGEMWLMSPYDRETASSYTYEVQASTSSNQVATATFTVHVEDINDNTPEYGSNIYFVNIAEDVAANTVIATYLATDADNETLFGPLTHAIDSGDTTMFSYGSTDGILTLIGTLDYESVTSYTLVLHAADAGTPTLALAKLTGSTTVVISVTNTNDNVPQITPGTSTASLREDNSLGSTIVQVVASDDDTGITFTYSIDSGNTNNDFAIDPASGNVTQVRLLDRETTASYSLVIKATDNNNENVTATLDITVTDINDNDPAFSEAVYTFTVAHDAAPSTSVGTLVATDPDDGLSGTTTVTIDDLGVSGVFSLSGLEVQNDITMDYPTTSQYSFKVKVVDQDPVSPRTATSRVVVNVLPAVNEPKFDPNSDTVSVQENTNVGFQIYDLDATTFGASESDNTMKYEISSTTVIGGFTVIASTGEVVVSGTLDYEVATQYVMVIKACIISDCTNKKDEFTLTIDITDLNDNTPYFSEESYEFEVDEDVTTNYIIDTITAQDDDASSPYNDLTYTLSGTSTHFVIQDDTGGILQTGVTALDYITQNVYYYTLTAADGGTPPEQAVVSVVINVKDVNTNDPAFATGTDVTVSDSNHIGSEVWHVHATDADTGVAGELRYAILTDTSNGVFSINSTTGIMTTNSLMDAVLEPTYTLVIQVEDGGNPSVRSATQTLTITVDSTSPNYNDPTFSSNPITTSLARASSIGTIVTTASASDDDNGISGSVRHKIISGNNEGLFAIESDTGIIRTTVSVVEAENFYSLVVVGKDEGTPQRSGTTTVSIAMDSDKTSFSTVDYYFEISEDAAVNTEVGRINVDTGRTVTGAYTILLGNFGNTFKISTNPSDSRGILAIDNPADYETKANYSMQISVVSDVGTLYKVVQVAILDANDNPPVWDEVTYTITIPEALPVGYTVMTAPWSDEDTMGVNRNNLVEIDSQGSQFFAVDQAGVVTVTTSPDYETMLQPFSFSMTIKEQNSPFKTATTVVSMSVLDIEEEFFGGIWNRDPLISLECPYPSDNGHVVYTLEVGHVYGVDNVDRFDFDTTNLESTEWYNIPVPDDPFSMDKSTGEITVVDATKLTVDTQYVRWVVARSTYSDNSVEAKWALIRIDTFDKYGYMVVIQFSDDLTTLNSRIAGFRTRTQFFFTYPELLEFANTYDTSTTVARRRKRSTTQSVAYTYALANRLHENEANINTQKTFMTSGELLVLLQDNADGTPITGLASSGLTPTEVGPFAESVDSVISKNESFWETTTGIAIMALLCIFIAILVAIVVAVVIYNRSKLPPPPKEDYNRLPTPVIEDTISIVSTDEVETRRWNAQRWDFMDDLVYKKKP